MIAIGVVIGTAVAVFFGRALEAQLFEVKSADILQPGPAALTDGVRRIHEILTDFVSRD